jgi:hypothetical protein
MYSKIIVGYDGSDHATDGLHSASSRAQPARSSS